MPKRHPTHKIPGQGHRQHSEDVIDIRPSAAKRGYDRKWRRLRMHKLNRTPLCERCSTPQRPVPASDVHHKKPLSEGGKKYEWSNLESLCHSCHSTHTRREAMRKPRQTDQHGSTT
jgi:5-methylcytosine-specific restriction protein A